MWVHRLVALVKPGLMAEAVAHAKTAPPEEGVTYRMLRPVTGEDAGNKLIFEFSFEDPDAYFSWLGNPQPPDEWMKHWIELSQFRGLHELYEVEHSVEAEGKPGTWVDRRIRYVKDRRRGEMITLWRGVSALPVAGFSLRVLTPRTGERDGDILIIETTATSLVELEKAIGAFGSSPEGSAFVLQLHALEQCMATRELLRVVT